MRHLTKELNISWDQVHHLFVSTPHSPYLRRHRMSYLIGRVQLVSFVFAILIPLWAVIDFMTFPWPEWALLTGMRVASGAVFVLLAWPWDVEPTPRVAFSMLTVVLLGPPVFYLVSQPMLSGLELSTWGGIASQFYALLPFIVLAGLSVFPLTILEMLVFGVPFLAITAYGASLVEGFNLATYIGTLWLAMLILAVSLFAGVSQLRYMISLVSRSSLDPLTNTYTRRSGSEIIDMQYRVSIRQGAAFTIAFFDLDHFKSVNDTYGHDEGDKTLCMFTKKLQDDLRGSDVIVRWGGEEFLAVLPNTDLDGARLVINRIMDNWLGQRPDGTPLTASIGVAERTADQLDDWPDLVELADKRMYIAKNTGRARAIMSNDEVLLPSDKPLSASA
ncbi:MAG: diguanylate cyclase [Magnetovibrio sp.]|nr:diguanylate cyclase [Magnetovibrio sp.]